MSLVATSSDLLEIVESIRRTNLKLNCDYKLRMECSKKGHEETKVLGEYPNKAYVHCLKCGEYFNIFFTS